MAIQQPNISKFKKASPSVAKKSQQSQPQGESNSMFLEMGKAALPMLPKNIKYAIGAAIFFLIWGIVSFNYCMVIWLHWWFLLAIVSSFELIQISADFKLVNKLGIFLKKLKP